MQPQNMVQTEVDPLLTSSQQLKATSDFQTSRNIFISIDITENKITLKTTNIIERIIFTTCTNGKINGS